MRLCIRCSDLIRSICRLTPYNPIQVPDACRMHFANHTRIVIIGFLTLLPTFQLNAAEQEKLRGKKEHEGLSKTYEKAQIKVEQLGKKLRKSIAKSA